MVCLLFARYKLRTCFFVCLTLPFDFPYSVRLPYPVETKRGCEVDGVYDVDIKSL